MWEPDGKLASSGRYNGTQFRGNPSFGSKDIRGDIHANKEYFINPSGISITIHIQIPEGFMKYST
jgi:hypothetical protein